MTDRPSNAVGHIGGIMASEPPYYRFDTASKWKPSDDDLQSVSEIEGVASPELLEITSLQLPPER